MGTQKNRLDENPKQVFKLMDKKIIDLLRLNFLLDRSYEYVHKVMVDCLVQNAQEKV